MTAAATVTIMSLFLSGPTPAAPLADLLEATGTQYDGAWVAGASAARCFGMRE